MRRTCVPSLGTAVMAVAMILASGCSVEHHMSSMDRNTERMAAELEHDRQYIRELTEQLKLMAESIQALQKMSAEVMQLVIERVFKPQTPSKTPDIDDILNVESNLSETEPTS
jgi:hypothetical protein